MSSLVIIIVLVSILSISTTAIFLIYGSPEQRRMEQRLKRFTDPAGIPQVAKGPARQLSAAKSKTVSVSFDQKIRQYLPNADQMRLRVERAGFDVNLSIVFLVIIGLSLLFGWSVSILTPFSGQVSLIVGFALGLLMPTLIISMRGKSHIKKFNDALPDSIDRSGLPVAEGIESVATNLTGPISDEFRKISDQVKIGMPLEDALARSVQRVGAPDFAFLSIALAIQKETGGNLTETLNNLSRLLRQRNQMQLKIRALTSEARSSAIIIGALPFLVFAVLIVINPSYVSILIEDETGRIVSGVALASMGLGYLIMARMVKFQI
jgi:tight adherence protein B